MRARLTKMGVVLAALAAFALGGSALATAAHKNTPPAPPAAQSQANQPAPAVADTPAEAQSSAAEAQSGAADTDTVQQGDQTGTDQADSPSEQAASESGPSDGPGGYADTSPTADTQQQGEN